MCVASTGRYGEALTSNGEGQSLYTDRTCTDGINTQSNSEVGDHIKVDGVEGMRGFWCHMRGYPQGFQGMLSLQPFASSIWQHFILWCYLTNKNFVAKLTVKSSGYGLLQKLKIENPNNVFECEIHFLSFFSTNRELENLLWHWIRAAFMCYEALGAVNLLNKMTSCQK